MNQTDQLQAQYNVLLAQFGETVLHIEDLQYKQQELRKQIRQLQVEAEKIKEVPPLSPVTEEEAVVVEEKKSSKV